MSLEAESPVIFQISFNKLLERYDVMAVGDDKYLADKAKRILDAQAPFPDLRKGFTDISLLSKYGEAIDIILQDTFPEVLTYNEIKAASLPYANVLFNSSRRFREILASAGQDFEPKISDLTDDISYIMSCTVILNFYYGYKLNFNRPFFYDIPDANGIMRRYRILYNVDFMEFIATDKAKKLSRADVDGLLYNYDDQDLWKAKIPPNSFIAKGFVIANMIDVTVEQAISEIKSDLIASDKWGNDRFMADFNGVFRSLLGVPDVRIGYTSFNALDKQFERVHGNGIDSFMLWDGNCVNCSETLCKVSYDKLLQENTYFAIADMDKYIEACGETPLSENLKRQGIQSAILAPIINNGKVLGILELVSAQIDQLNYVNAQKLDDLLPYIAVAVQRSITGEENRIAAIIQHECTSVHPAVYWKFREEAKRFIEDSKESGQPSFGEIVFNGIYPLYGQTDIKNSSQARNAATLEDLLAQLSEIKNILRLIWEKNELPIYEALMFRVNENIEDITSSLHTNSEQAIFDFIKEDIEPVFAHIQNSDNGLGKLISAYRSKINPDTESYYNHRHNYEESVTRINKKLASILDSRQGDAQAMYPHYFERYKTDGVEHNLFIGGEIVPDSKFDVVYRNNLRIWQLQVVCEMENAHYGLKPKLKLPLDVASLILVYNTSISIRFRMDEKRFDVDGTYNARYEVLKKRIDKSFIKGTSERLTKPGMLAIVYSQKKDELEYLRYIKFLKSKGYFGDKIEVVALEGLQGVSGLKAIRVEILYKKDREDKKNYTYGDLMEELKG
ncbi:GAF domain-containing protein [Flavobacteriaceae bacterium F89]|uniref:GAF domain-containing protein n=1 Tax=Cerina litoralis TaxID=2874477 RepID=A0AAE3ES22_9FLAO|nr:GAF domain-containing protein [Cerina litoralis]MCG2459995.1 GAF domain-containing protein [Cerina litoralis]